MQEKKISFMHTKTFNVVSKNAFNPLLGSIPPLPDYDMNKIFMIIKILMLNLIDIE